MIEEVKKTAEVQNADNLENDVQDQNNAAGSGEKVNQKKSNLRGRWKRPNGSAQKDRQDKQPSSEMTEIKENVQEAVVENKSRPQDLRNKTNDNPRPRFRENNQKPYRLSDDKNQQYSSRQQSKEPEVKAESCCLLGGIKSLLCRLFGKKPKTSSCTITELSDSSPKKKYYNKNRSYSKRYNKPYKKPENN